MAWTRLAAVGHGSSATVYLAADATSGDLFAVKSTELPNSKFLKTEQRILSTLSHPSIVEYRGFNVTKENGKLMYNLFMEYATGGTIADEILRRGGRINETAAGLYMRQILRGLEYLHKRGLVHCDIKPKNVLIGGDGLKIADFGCSKWVGETAAIGGTPMYMAPEVARGEKQGLSSDIWALGCTLIEMVTGTPPWPNVDDPVSVVYRIGYSGDTPEIPRFVSDKAKDFLGKCLRRNPMERWSAIRLLEHPFLEELSFGFEEIKELQINSNSPTSILDQGIWNSLEEQHTLLKTEYHHDDRIRRLSKFSGEIEFELEDENWITSRGIERDENNRSFNGEDESEIDYRISDFEEKGERIGNGKVMCLELFDKIVRFRVEKSDVFN